MIDYQDDRKNDRVLVKLQIGEIIESDLGIYTCTMQGVREMGDVKFEGSFRINRAMINEHRLTQTNISASCVLKMTLSLKEIKAHFNGIKQKNFNFWWETINMN